MPGRDCCQPGPGLCRQRKGWWEEPGSWGGGGCSQSFQAGMREMSALGREGQEGRFEQGS